MGIQLPSRTAMVRNILREYRATDRETGRNWYYEAYGTASAYAADYGVSLSQAVGVIAALSPQTQWWQNLMLARQVLNAGAMVQGHTRDTMRKVNAILAGVEPLDVLGGLKVRSFYENIHHPWSGDAVTVDRHAFRTATRWNDAKAVPTDRVYRDVADAYRHAARLASREDGRPVLAHQLQAIVWVPRAA